MVRAGSLLLRIETRLTGPVGFLLHPDYLELSRSPLEADNCLRGRVVSVRRRRFILEAGIKVGELLIRVPVAGGSSGQGNFPRVNEDVWCRIRPGAIRLFPLETEAASRPGRAL
jgi:hypothetical protein